MTAVIDIKDATQSALNLSSSEALKAYKEENMTNFWEYLKNVREAALTLKALQDLGG